MSLTIRTPLNDIIDLSELLARSRLSKEQKVFKNLIRCWYPLAMKNPVINISTPKINKLDSSITAAIQQKIDTKTKPLGSLGKIEKIAKQLCLIQQSLNPDTSSCELMLFAADHGIAESGVSAFPADVTRQMVQNFLNGGAAANVFARQNNVELSIVDTGVKGDAIDSTELISKRIAPGTKNFLNEPAMTQGQLAMAISNGIALATKCKHPVIGFGEMGIANTSSAAMIVAKLTDHSLTSLVGRGTGLDDAGLTKKLNILELASNRTADKLDAWSCLAEYGGFEIATMCGAMLGAASTGRVLLIDGYIATAALVAAHAVEPNIMDYCIFAHASAESGHQLMLNHVNGTALFDLELRLGEGTGTLLAWPLIQSAAAMMNQMASFDDAGVSDQKDL